MLAWGQTHLAQVTEMCKLPPEAPLISNLGAFSPKTEEWTDEIFFVRTVFERFRLRSSRFLVRASVITCATGSYTEDLPVRGSLKVVVRVLWSTK